MFNDQTIIHVNDLSKDSTTNYMDGMQKLPKELDQMLSIDGE